LTCGLSREQPAFFDFVKIETETRKQLAQMSALRITRFVESITCASGHVKNKTLQHWEKHYEKSCVSPALP
jgi:hypothetical protein